MKVSDLAPAISGNYQPNQLFSAFDGKDPNGDWTITISDVASGNGGEVVAAELVIHQTGGVISFPTSNDVMVQTEGGSTYTVIGIDGIIGLEYSFTEIPINVSIDWKPVLNIIGYSGFWGDGGALSVRYMF